MIRRTLPLAIAASVLLLAACGGSYPFDTPTVDPTSSGHVLTVTPSVHSATSTPADTLYTVQTGDTLSAIADRYGISLDLLMQVNSIADPSTLQAGDVLILPGVGVTPQPTVTATPAATPASVALLLQLVDKQHPLPSGYEPPDVIAVPGPYSAPGYSSTMNATALTALESMLDAANTAGYDIRVVSGYRSYADQQYTYNYWVGQLGEEQANRVSAKPGYSEHQLGMTADLGSADFGWDLTDTFGDTPDGQWLIAHSIEYGFVLSYPEGKEDITGYAYEPWHFRYLGITTAADYAASGLTLNQYLANQ